MGQIELAPKIQVVRNDRRYVRYAGAIIKHNKDTFKKAISDVDMRKVDKKFSTVKLAMAKRAFDTRVKLFYVRPILRWHTPIGKHDSALGNHWTSKPVIQK